MPRLSTHICHPLLRSVRLIFRPLLARQKSTRASKKRPVVLYKSFKTRYNTTIRNPGGTPLHTEKKISGEVPFDGRIFRVERDEVELENGRRSFREVARHKSGGACVLCELDGKVAFVRQFRYAYGQELLELPAGKIDPGETPAACAARELREETGMVAGRLIDLGECCPSPGWMVERLHIFTALDKPYKIVREETS